MNKIIKLSIAPVTWAFFMLLSLLTHGQNCYVRLDDASGLNTDLYQADLDSVACDLVNIFPLEFQNQFQIFDFGFYLHQDAFSGGFPDAFQQKVDEVAAASPYYLLFGKQTDPHGVYTTFWVDLKLPDTGDFECLDLVSDDFRDQLKDRITNEVNMVYDLNNKIPHTYYQAEIAAINELKNKLSELWDCCDPGTNFRSPSSCSPIKDLYEAPFEQVNHIILYAE